MTNEEPEILFLDAVPLGYEPIIDGTEVEELAREYWRLRRDGRAVVLTDNGDGTIGLWELRWHFWIHP